MKKVPKLYVFWDFFVLLLAFLYDILYLENKEEGAK